jgi:hypothetical protein
VGPSSESQGNRLGSECKSGLFIRLLNEAGQIRTAQNVVRFDADKTHLIRQSPVYPRDWV